MFKGFMKLSNSESLKFLAQQVEVGNVGFISRLVGSNQCWTNINILKWFEILVHRLQDQTCLVSNLDFRFHIKFLSFSITCLKHLYASRCINQNITQMMSCVPVPCLQIRFDAVGFQHSESLFLNLLPGMNTVHQLSNVMI